MNKMDMWRMTISDSVSELTVEFDRSTNECLSKVWGKFILNIMRTEEPLNITIVPADEEENE